MHRLRSSAPPFTAGLKLGLADLGKTHEVPHVDPVVVGDHSERATAQEEIFGAAGDGEVSDGTFLRAFVTVTVLPLGT